MIFSPGLGLLPDPPGEAEQVFTLLQSLHPLGVPKQLPPEDAGKHAPDVPPDRGGPAYLVVHPPSEEQMYRQGTSFSAVRYQILIKER